MITLDQIDKLFEDLNSKDGQVRYAALQELFRITDEPVDWIYDKWFVLTDKLSSDNSFQRSIGLMLLANLAKSDTGNRMSQVLEKFLGCFEDEKFITSRQCIQHVWKIAIAHDANRVRIIKELEKTYFENIHLSTHGNLIKEDVVFSLCQIAKYAQDSSALQKANELVGEEVDPKLVKSLKRILTK